MTFRLQVKGSDIESSGKDGQVFWSLPIASIVLISEYTTDEGPQMDDYFLVFVTVEKDTFCFHTTSFYAAGTDETLATIKKILNTTFELRLTASAEWDSRVIWPKEVEGSKYFEFKPIPPETFLQKVKEKVVGTTFEYGIAKPIQEFLLRHLKEIS